MDFKVDNIGKYLLEKRKEKNLTLKEVANTIGLTAGYISRIERGSSTPSKDVLKKICNIYEIDYNDVIDENGEITVDNISMGTDILELISSDKITYKGKLIGFQDRINLLSIVQTLLEIEDLDVKNNYIEIIRGASSMVSKTIK